MQFNLQGKTALITGSSKGIGWSIAEALHKEGCRIALNGRNLSELKIAANKLSKGVFALGDVSKSDEAQRVVNETIAQLGHLDILVCNVGNGRSVPPGSENSEEWLRMLSLNLWSVTNTVEAAKKFLASSKGVIVCVSSICGIEVVPGAPVTYSVAKAALNAYIRGISRPLGKQGVRINAVAPGNILFEGSVWESKLSSNPVEVKEMLSKDVALGRMGSTNDIANLVTYLASPISSFATGAVWTLDGGQVHI